MKAGLRSNKFSVLVPALAVTALIAGCQSTTNSALAVEAAAPAHGAQDPGGAPPLPPGWTQADWDKCMAAGMPGSMHEWLGKGVGSWKGTSTMWMAAGAEPMTSPVTAKCEKVMDGRFTRCEYSGDMAGMPFNGLGFFGYDNVSKKFVASWMDNCGTGIMRGEGKQTADGKGIEWTYEYNCPIAGPSKMTEIERRADDNTMTLEAHGKDPKSGKEYKMMYIEMKRERGS